MQKQWEITCKGKNLNELKEALTDALNELTGLATIKNVSVRRNLDKPELSGVQREHYDNSDAEDNEEYVDESEIGQSLKSSTQAIERDLASSGRPAPVVNMNELDSEGIPWDSRIHASSKAKVANGTWRIKRGVEDVDADKVKAEYRGSLQQPSHATLPERTISTGPQMVHAPVVQLPPNLKVMQTPVTPVAPLPTMNSGHTLETFSANFPLILAQLITEGKIKQDYVNQLKIHFGVDQIWQLNDAQKAETFKSWVDYKIIQQVG